MNTLTHETDRQRQAHQQRIQKIRQRLVIDHGYLENLTDISLAESAARHHLDCAIECLMVDNDSNGGQPHE